MRVRSICIIIYMTLALATIIWFIFNSFDWTSFNLSLFSLLIWMLCVNAIINIFIKDDK